jgi:uncharacterized membrane protein (DUF2068 family)
MYVQRPLGVTVIAILTVIGGLGFLGSGALIFALIPLLGIIIGGVLVIIGIAYFVMAYGLWNGRRWAWKLTLILSVIGIILGIGSIVVGNVGSLFHTIINAVVIYYLYRPNVKDYFGR